MSDWSTGKRDRESDGATEEERAKKRESMLGGDWGDERRADEAK